MSWDNKALSSCNIKQEAGENVPIILILQDLHTLLSYRLSQLDKIIRQRDFLYLATEQRIHIPQEDQVAKVQ